MIFRQIPAQDARGVFKEKMLDDLEYIGEEKFDGDRRISQFCEDGRIRFTGRNPGVDGLFVEKTENLPHLNWNPYQELYGTVLDGEIVTPESYQIPIGEPRSKYVTSIMGSDPEEAIRKQKERGFLQYKVFDCLFYAGEDIRDRPLFERKIYVAKAVEIWNNPQAKATRIWKNKRDLIQVMRAERKEGAIIKWLGARYYEKKHWSKIKFSWTADTVIMGFDPPEQYSTKSDGTYSETKFHLNGWIGAIRCGQYVNGTLTYCASVSGMSDSLRAEISSGSQYDYIGKVLRIKHYGREPTGFFRSPQFGDFRTDKDPTACIQDLNEM